MNNEFKSEEFVELTLRKAEELGLYKEALEEMELYRKNNQIEYLFLVYKCVESIKKEVFEYPILRMAGATSICAYVLGIHDINPKEHELSNKCFFQRSYKYNLKPRFDISVPKGTKEEVVKLLKRLTQNKVELYTGGIYKFGNNKQFELGIYESDLLKRCKLALEIAKDYQYGSEYFDDIINYMLEPDKKGYYLPNLAGCIFAYLPSFYKYMEVGKPQNLEELAMILSINNTVFKDDEFVLDCLKEYGFEDTICSREQVLMILNRYDIDEDRAMAMLNTLSSGNDLFESDKMLLKSNDVPKYIIDQLSNIRYLGYICFALQEVKIAYKMVTCKKWFLKDFEKLLKNYSKNISVGPFFYIDKHLYASYDHLEAFHPLVRFFDAPISHFDYFETLSIDGDYGNYPRGRVIYDNFSKKFIVYLDKSLDNEAIKESIMLAYNLPKERTVFKRDPHYTHDYL